MTAYLAQLRSANAPEVAIRRDLHRFPETAFAEYRTASLVAETLARLSYEVRTGEQVMRASSIVDPPSAEADAEAMARAIDRGGVPDWIARMQGGLTAVAAEKRFGDGPVLAFRFDMDALPVTEDAANAHHPHRAGFASEIPGRMHACGHDGHTAIGLTLAHRLSQATGLSGAVRLIFQPAEEGGRGAQPIIDAGVLEDVDQLYVGHLGCGLASGKLAPDATGFLHSSRHVARFAGRAAHAAMAPQEGRNALLAGAAAALALHAIPRVAGEETFVNVGRMRAGTGFNVVPDGCELFFELRAESAAGHDGLCTRAQQIIAGAAMAQGVTHQIAPYTQQNGNENHPQAVARIADAARALPEVEVVGRWSIGGGDDASKMIRRVNARGGRAAYFIIGADIAAPHHASSFDFDESALSTGCHVFENIARQVLGPSAP